MGEHRVLAGFLRFVFEFVDETAIFVDSEFMWKVTSRIFKNQWKPSLTTRVAIPVHYGTVF